MNIERYENPLIIAGHGIRLSGAIDLFHELLDKLNIPVVTTFNGFDIVASDHPNFAGRIGTMGTPEGNKILREADLVLCIGTRNNVRQIGYKKEAFAKSARKVVLVDVDEDELYKTGVGLKVRRFCCMDAKQFIQECLDYDD
ncbi:MAG: hypothetical protein GY853_01715 [PVC group bacterium]|nr:hypothetical protein [PVC group bacterium]